MKCPFCGHADDRVLDTRVQKDGSIRRRRECLECKARFSTVETIMLAFPFIIKKDGRREPYSKEKILKGLQAACQKRPVGLAQIDAVVERISAWVVNRGESEISSRLIGKKVMAELKQLDDVAYIRFASVYRTFKDVQEFVETLEDAELLDFVDANNPQLSLTAMNFVENEKKPNNETDSKTTSPRTRTPNPLSN
ncbi:MAG: NrdR family transcriptional regulator [Bdellovibrio sp. ArHS]|uniref:transcriptional regulator NrdR n=1 Tax=Bdellovibrio sp. ArHS TaxID=1569284 RepID=UPI000583D752|nr:transcriptional regulator NrdR [Bdellovibrio sp. ArHS]KHD89433.1 MAG: NrdR family transcriptional regulator [Bdellovibrio sp. ArHS]